MTTRITRLRDGDPMIVDHYDVGDDGSERFVGTDYLPSLEERAALDALEAHRAVLRQQLDRSQDDPSEKEFRDAQAFVALAADAGVVAAAQAAGITVEP